MGLWWLFLAAAWVVTQRCVGYRQVNTFTLFLPLLVVTNGLFVPWSRDLNAVITGYDLSDSAFASFWIALGLMYAAMPVGICLANRFRNPAFATIPVLLTTTRNPANARVYIAFVIVLSVVSLVQIYAAGVQLDLVSYFTGFESFSEYVEHRYPFAAATSGPAFYLYNRLAYGIAPLAYVLIWNWPGWSRAWKCLLLALVALTVIQSGHKEPLVLIGGTLVTSWYAIRQGLRLTRRFYVLVTSLGIVMVVVVLPLFYMTQGVAEYGSALYWGVYRVLGEPLRTLQLYFEVYPTYHPHLHGMSSRTVAALVGAENYLTAGQYIPNVFLGIENTTFPALFIGDAWADFGYAGVFTYSVFIGFVLQVYNVWYFSRPARYLEDTALLLTIAIATEHLFASTVFSALLTFGLGTSLIMYLAVRGVRLARQTSRTTATVRALP